MSGRPDEGKASVYGQVPSARLIARIRWVGVALALAEGISATPAPVFGRISVLLVAAVMASYNVPLTLLERLPRSWSGALIAIGVTGDFAACGAWTFLTANDVFSTAYAVYGLVAIEAAMLYRRRGTVLFISAFVATFGAFYLVRLETFGFAAEPGSVVFRTSIVVLTAVFVGALVDQSEHRREALVAAAARQYELLRHSLWQAQRHESLLQAISDVGEGLVITERGRMIYGNDAYVRLTGYTAEELTAMPSLLELAPDDQRRELAQRLARRMAGDEVPHQYESQLVTKDGRVIDIETALRVLSAESSDRIIAVVRDISERKRVEMSLQESERVAHAAARRDPLTGVANRRAWDEELERAIARSRRDGTPLSVAIIDLDGFKEYNDDWGHLMGDRQLQMCAEHWRTGLRAVDFLARYGGDEFAVLFHGATLEEASDVLDRLRASMPTNQSFSTGVAEYNGEEPTDSLMARADAALYDRKRSGPGRVPATVSGVDGPAWGRLIPQMLAERSLSAVYQPICRLDDREVVGYEALARPTGFAEVASVEGLFAAAQRLGYSRDVDWLCRRVALEGAKRLPKDLPIFINVSTHALLDPLHGVDQMLLIVRWSGRTPEDVVFEISERENVRDLVRLDVVLGAYREAGFRFAVDDVGEGHSTLEVLACARPEYIKVARSLSVSAGDRGARAALMALVTFAESNGSQLIAEGLETEQHVTLMRELGLQLGQGFTLAKPRHGAAAKTLIA